MHALVCQSHLTSCGVACPSCVIISFRLPGDYVTPVEGDHVLTDDSCLGDLSYLCCLQTHSVCSKALSDRCLSPDKEGIRA